MSENDSRATSHSFECVEDQVTCVEFSPFEASSHLIAYGGYSRISVGMCRFQEEDKDCDGFAFKHLRDFHHGRRVVAIAWSPETSIDVLPRCLRFCSAGDDHRITVYTSDLQDQDSMVTIDGHRDHVNAVSFEPTEGQLIASVSDDHSCCVWDLEGNQKARFTLKAAGVSVCWNAQDPMKLMVAEKRGTIRFYDLLNQQPIMSLDAGHVTLMSADWCQRDPTRVGAIANGKWMVWDITRLSFPEDSQQAHTEGGRHFRWSHASENLFATTGGPGNQLKVFHMGHHQVPVSASLPVMGSISWHAFLPACAVGGDRRVHIWVAEL